MLLHHLRQSESGQDVVRLYRQTAKICGKGEETELGLRQLEW